MSIHDSIAMFFDRKAARFDAIYLDQKPLVHKLWDGLTRRNISQRFAFTMKTLSPLAGKHVLDVGCGSGRYSVAFALEGAQVIGVDLSAHMLHLARHLAHTHDVSDNCSFVQSEIRSFSCKRPFDAVVAMGFFDYTVDPDIIFVDLLRLQWETLVASFPVATAIRVPFRKLWLNLHNCPVRFYKRSQIINMCKKVNLTCHYLVRTGPIYLLVVKRN